MRILEHGNLTTERAAAREDNLRSFTPTYGHEVVRECSDGLRISSPPATVLSPPCGQSLRSWYRLLNRSIRPSTFAGRAWPV